MQKNRLGIWDAEKQSWLGEIQLIVPILRVLVRRNVIVLVTEREVRIYSLAKLMLMERLETIANPYGVSALSSSATTLFACPTLLPGQVRFEFFDKKSYRLLEAHKTELSVLALSPDSEWLATASVCGTLIRIWHVESNVLIQELRRGVNSTVIQSLSFDLQANYLLCTSEKQTLHIFGTGIRDSKHQCAWNKRSILYKCSSYLPSYFQSQWSGAQFPIDAGTIAVFDYQKSDPVVLLIDRQAKIKELDWKTK
jgi:WD40 repeat protein